MDWNSSDRIYRERILEFYEWLSSWHEWHARNPFNIVVQDDVVHYDNPGFVTGPVFYSPLWGRINSLYIDLLPIFEDKGNPKTLVSHSLQSPQIHNETFEQVDVNEYNLAHYKCYNYFDWIKKIFSLNNLRDAFSIWAFIYILYQDWNNRNSGGPFYLNNKILSPVSLFNFCATCTPILDKNGNPSHDYYYSLGDLMMVLKNHSEEITHHNIIPPEWFKFLPIDGKVASDFLSSKSSLPEESSQPVFYHNESYTFVKINGKEFHLSDTQASIIRLLNEAFESNPQDPCLHSKDILGQVKSGSMTFNDHFKYVPSWKPTLIVMVRKGLYRIAR